MPKSLGMGHITPSLIPRFSLKSWERDCTIPSLILSLGMESHHSSVCVLFTLSTDCATICHPKCIDSLPNNCCLPPELASHVSSDQPSLAKKVRIRINQEPLPEFEEASSGSGHSSSESEREKGEKGRGKRFGRRKEKSKEDIIKTEKVFVPK